MKRESVARRERRLRAKEARETRLLVEIPDIEAWLGVIIPGRPWREELPNLKTFTDIFVSDKCREYRRREAELLFAQTRTGLLQRETTNKLRGCRTTGRMGTLPVNTNPPEPDFESLDEWEDLGASGKDWNPETGEARRVMPKDMDDHEID